MSNASKMNPSKMNALNRKVPLRKCVGCGLVREKRDMMRVLKTPEGTVVLDVTGRKNGRGAYLCRSAQCLADAVRKKGLERSLKMKVPEEVYESLEVQFGQSGSEEN